MSENLNNVPIYDENNFPVSEQAIADNLEQEAARHGLESGEEYRALRDEFNRQGMPTAQAGFDAFIDNKRNPAP